MVKQALHYLAFSLQIQTCKEKCRLQPDLFTPNCNELHFYTGCYAALQGKVRKKETSLKKTYKIGQIDLQINLPSSRRRIVYSASAATRNEIYGEEEIRIA